MSATTPAPEQPSRPGTGVPRWAWVVMVALLLVAVVAVTVAVFAPRGEQSLGAPAPEDTAPQAAPTAPSATPSPSTSATAAPEQASGCLGGPAELDAAVLAAQQDAPLTEEGAAAFAATVFRWATGTPAAPFQAETAEQVLSPEATDAARNISGTRDADGTTFATSFEDGRYYVESYDSTSAIVSLLGTGSGTDGGAPVGDTALWGSVHLESINGAWHFRDITEARSAEDLERIGTPYVGGC